MQTVNREIRHRHIPEIKLRYLAVLLRGARKKHPTIKHFIVGDAEGGQKFIAYKRVGDNSLNYGFISQDLVPMAEKIKTAVEERKAHN